MYRCGKSDSGFSGVADLYTNQLWYFHENYYIELYMNPEGGYVLIR